MLAFSLARNLLRDQWCVPAYHAQYALKRARAGLVTRPLGEIATIRSGAYVAEYAESGVTYLRVDNIREFQVNENPEDVAFVPRHLVRDLERCCVEENDVLIARTGTLGKAALALGAPTGYVMSQHVTRLSCREGNLPGYLTCCLNSPLGKAQLIAGGFGSTRLELTHSALGEIKIPWVAESLQKKIHELVVEGCRRNNSATERLRSCVRDLENYLGIEVIWANEGRVFQAKEVVGAELWTPRFFDPSLCGPVAELEERFVCNKLGALAHITRGCGTRVVDYVRGGIPFVRTTSLTNYGIDPFPDHYATEETYREYNQPVLGGDILYSIEGKIGMSAYVLDGQRCVFKNHVERIRSLGEVDPVYLFLFLNTSVAKAQAYRNAVTQATLPGMASRLRELVVPLSVRGRTPKNIDKVREELGIRARSGFSEKARAVELWRQSKKLLAEALDRAR